MRAPQGYATIVDPDAPRAVERDTITCGHCGRVVFVKPGTAATTYLIANRQTGQWREEPGALCRVCMRPTCLAHDCLDRCLVLERRLEQSEQQDRFRRQVAGLTTG